VNLLARSSNLTDQASHNEEDKDAESVADADQEEEEEHSQEVAPDFPEPAGEKCGLHWLREKLYLFAMVPTSDYVLTRHFLTHYASLGIMLWNQSFLVLHKKDPTSIARTLQILRDFNIQHYKLTSKYTSKIKREFVNKWLQKLPLGSWAVYPDGDEFFEYPCNLSAYMQSGISRFWGRMADRLGPDLTFPEVQEEPEVAKQYPFECPELRRKLTNGIGCPDKFMLFKVHSASKRPVQMHSSHSFEGDCKGCGKFADNFLGYFAHYFFTGKATIQKMLYKINIHVQKTSRKAYNALKHLLVIQPDGSSSWTAEGKTRASALCRLAKAPLITSEAWHQ